MNFGVFDFSRLAVTDWRLRRWRLWFLALSNDPQNTVRQIGQCFHLFSAFGTEIARTVPRKFCNLDHGVFRRSV